MDQIIAVIDRSTSMGGYEEQTISGYNEFIKEQLKISSDASVTLILFDNEYKVVYKNVSLPDVEDLTNKEYHVQGATALHDALGKAISIAEEVERNNDISKTIIAIFTDGMENNSKECTAKQIKTKVKTLEEKNKWEFIYVGCDHDVFAVSQSLGMKSSNTKAFSKQRLGSAMSVDYSSTVAEYRSK